MLEEWWKVTDDDLRCQNPDRAVRSPLFFFATRDLVAKVDVGDACQALPSLPILPNFADMAKYNTVTVHRQPRHDQYLWERINIRELEVSLATHPEF
jgi:hypothetical protein